MNCDPDSGRHYYKVDRETRKIAVICNCKVKKRKQYSGLGSVGKMLS